MSTLNRIMDFINKHINDEIQCTKCSLITNVWKLGYVANHPISPGNIKRLFHCPECNNDDFKVYEDKA